MTVLHGGALGLRLNESCRRSWQASPAESGLQSRECPQIIEAKQDDWRDHHLLLARMESPAAAPGQSDEAPAKPRVQQESDELRKSLVAVGHKAQDFVTPLKAAGGRTMTYPSVQKSTPVSNGEANLPKRFDAIAGTAPIPVMQGIRLLIEEKEKELTALSASRVHGVEARAR